jgi:hypothetical protein
MDEIIGKLDRADYWEWRTTVTELQLAQMEAEREAFKVATMEKDLEIARLKTTLYRRSLDGVQAKLDAAEREYARYTETLETKLGLSLKNTVIDDVTYEVKKFKE